MLALARMGMRSRRGNHEAVCELALELADYVAGALAGVGFLMPPALAAVLMSVSTIVVALNAQLLRRVRFRG